MHHIAQISTQLRIFGQFSSGILRKSQAIVAKKRKVSQAVFIALVEEEWQNISDEVVLTCITSMPDRIQACIEAEGGHTEY